ncbi:hypothetical protein FOMPIDRAFT_129119 [Fomitopsis schrenkii]|uniref:Uncharacterized protein n=1 Tax=Fomitopsis schrenkii TaxID=2126942 RepID=S8FN32_FOMSC|nr:hypothetical protein FOMPIDRAFT_129119 [Fomitopsis schrenkii]
MGLHQTHPAFVQFTSTLRTLAPNYFKMGHSFREQDPQQWKMFLEDVSEAVPLAAEYENQWPMEAYMRRWLATTSSRSRRGIYTPGILNRVRGCQPGREKTTACGASDKCHPSDSGGAHEPRRFGTVSASPSAYPTLVGPRRSNATPGASSDEAVFAASATLAGPSAPEQCEEAVRTFLQSLQPSSEVLLLRFLKAGIVNGDCIVALAGMPDREKDKLLRDDLCLTAFQSRVVRVGLAKLSL